MSRELTVPPMQPAASGKAPEQPGGCGFSRRELLMRAAIVGAAAAAPVRAVTEVARAAPAQEPFATLTAAESETLEAIVARLIPTDENGPGAAEAGAARYIDRALSGALASSREGYAAGLAAVDAYAQASKGSPFARLSATEQDAVLSEMEQNIATGFAPDSATFFNLLRTHTIEGTFCDPYYGGNANFVGWELIGYPGIRLAVGPDQQRMDDPPAPRYRSAYDFGQFLTGERDHGR